MDSSVHTVRDTRRAGSRKPAPESATRLVELEPAEQVLGELLRFAAVVPASGQLLDHVGALALRLAQADLALVALEELGLQCHVHTTLAGQAPAALRRWARGLLGVSMRRQAGVTGGSVAVRLYRGTGGSAAVGHFSAPPGIRGALVVGWQPGRTLAPVARTRLNLFLGYVVGQVTRQGLAEKSAQLDAIIDQMPSGVVALDLAGRVHLRNAAARKVVATDDLASRQATQLPGYQAFDPKTGEELLEANSPLKSALRGQVIDDYDYVLRRPGDLSDVVVRASYRPVVDTTGAVTGTMMVYSDITAMALKGQQQVAEAELGQLAINAPLQEVLDSAARAVKEALRVDCVTIGELSPDGQSLLGRAMTGWADPVPPNLPIELSARSPTTAAMAANRPIIVQDYANSEYTPPPEHRQPGIRGCLCVPIQLDSGVYGSIAAFAVRPRAFSEDDIQFLSVVGNIIGSAVDRARSRDALAANEQRYRTIIETSSEGVWTVNEQGQTTFVMGYIADMLGGSRKEVFGVGMSIFIRLE
ncbi:MAG: GAF domain-containing protein, partial [Chloroflexota bacterium]